MPVVHREGPYVFRIYSSDCGEPAHVHVEHGGARAKYWLESVRLQSCNKRFSVADAQKVERIIRENLRILLAGWERHCR